MNLFIIFLTGLTTGGLSCLAVQGGLLASVIANQKQREHDAVLHHQESKKLFSLRSFDTLDWLPVTLFLTTKLVAYTLVGFMLGLLGSAITLSLTTRLLFQTFTAIFMFATAMNLLEVHPVFRYLTFQPPRFLQRWVRSTSKSRALFAPAVLGSMTIFIPCGVTQAMQLLAIASGNPITGAMIMFAFVLGTSPLFAALGVATAKLSEGWYHTFTKVAAVILIGMSVYALNGVLTVMNTPWTLQRVTSPITYFFSPERFNSSLIPVQDGVQLATITVSDYGYQPKRLRVKANQPVQLTLQSKDTYSCAVAFVFKEFGIDTFLKPTDTQTFTFTPTQPGTYTYTCAMGMYTGVMEVL